MTEQATWTPEPVAWKVGVKAFVFESDALNWCEAIQEATNGEQNPVAVPLYALSGIGNPEAVRGLVEALEWYRDAAPDVIELDGGLTALKALTALNEKEPSE